MENLLLPLTLFLLKDKDDILETYNAYARQFVGQLTMFPDVDNISGLSPVIAIEQKTVSKNPRSTVGTITEIYDFLRLLFARVSTPISPKTKTFG